MKGTEFIKSFLVCKIHALFPTSFGNGLPICPNMVPKEFHLFPELKKALRGKLFRNYEEIKLDAKEIFDMQDTHFLRGILKIC